MNGLKYSEDFKLRLDIIYLNIWLCTVQEKGLNEFRYLAHFVATQTFLALTVFCSQQIIFAELNIRKTHRWKNWFSQAWTGASDWQIAVMPKNICCSPLCQRAIWMFLNWAHSMQGIPIGNFFFNQELFYLTHIYENWARGLGRTWQICHQRCGML